ncbi:O-antigen ligase family protein [Providencia manganoxydans]|uniref:O-antigen ligase family protein n=2 Tax=Providencia manganoxydans TaxID=2923283 RepID=UPI0034E55D40
MIQSKSYNIISHETLLIIFLLSLMSPAIGITIPGLGTLKASMLLSYFIIFTNYKCKFNLLKITPILLLLLFYGISSIWSISYSHSIIGIIGILQLIIYCFSFSILLSQYNKNEIITILIKSFTIMAFLTLIYYTLSVFTYTGGYDDNIKYYGMMIDRSMIRAKGFTDDPNIFSLYMGIALAIILFNKNTKKIPTLLIFLMFVLTLSRGGIIAFIGSSAIVFIFEFIISPAKQFKKILLFTLILTILFTIVHFNETIYHIIDKRLNDISSGSGRFDLWNSAFRYFFENPIFGHGIFTTKYIFEMILGKPAYTHNTFIELLLEGGISLLFVYLLLFFYLFILLFKNIKENLWLISCLVFIFIQFMTLSLSFNEFVYFIFIIILLFNNKQQVI